MKKILLKVFIIFSLIIVLSSIQTKADCYGDPTGCDNWRRADDFIYNYPGYDCDIHLVYDFRICNGAVQIKFVTIYFDWNGDCIDLFYWLCPGGFGTYADPIKLHQLLMFGYDHLAPNLFVWLYEDAKNGLGGDPEDFECPNRISMETYFDGFCLSWCYAWKMVGVGEYEVKFKSAACDATSCCWIKHSMCVDVERQIIVNERTTGSDPSDCEISHMPPNPCDFGPEWNVVQMPCASYCELGIP